MVFINDLLNGDIPTRYLSYMAGRRVFLFSLSAKYVMVNHVSVKNTYIILCCKCVMDDVKLKGGGELPI